MINSVDFWQLEKNSSLLARSGVESLQELQELTPKIRALVSEDKSLKRTPEVDDVTLGDAAKDKAVDPSDNVQRFLHTVSKFTSDILTSLEETVDVAYEAVKTGASLARQSTNAVLGIEGTPQSPTPVHAGDAEFKVSEENARIFALDAERTFVNAKNRLLLVEALEKTFEKVGDYHQGEGFVVAFLSLFLSVDEVVNVLVDLHHNHVPGYFSCTPQAYVRDARVLLKLLADVDAKFANHLQDLMVPETFVSKWFIGLNVHVLDFERVAEFITKLKQQGQVFLFKFGLAVLLHYKEQLATTNDVSYALQLLRLDDAILPKGREDRKQVYKNLLEEADDVKVDFEKVKEYRVEVAKELEELERKRREAAAATDYSDDEIVFTDEEDDGGGGA